MQGKRREEPPTLTSDMETGRDRALAGCGHCQFQPLCSLPELSGSTQLEVGGLVGVSDSLRGKPMPAWPAGCRAVTGVWLHPGWGKPSFAPMAVITSSISPARWFSRKWLKGLCGQTVGSPCGCLRVAFFWI